MGRDKIMTHASLFSGIGGFDLAAEWMGWENLFHCEWNDFGQRILKYYWPNSVSYGDITKTDFRKWRGAVDVLSGGFPCQPYSMAGKRLGKEDDRHLWPEMLRAIREIQPAWVVGENVRGLINWNGGMVFDEVQADLEAAGYEVLPFLLPACGVGAPHRRDRIWFVAYSPGNRREQQGTGDETENRKQGSRQTRELEGRLERLGFYQDATNANSRRQSGKEHREKKPGRPTKKSISNYWQNFPTQSPVCSGDDGLPSELDGVTFPKWRNESIKGYGNAIVPQVVDQIFQAINANG